MLRVMVKQARPGMTLARAINHPRQPENVLLAAGYSLTAPVITKLHEQGIYDLWIRYPGLEFLDEIISPTLTSQQQHLCDTLKLSFHNQAMRTQPRIEINQYRDIVQSLVRSLLTDNPAMMFLADAAKGDDILLSHSAEVCYLGVMVGLRLESYLVSQRKRLSENEARNVENLGLGCMLHDLGELQLPEKERESRRLSDSTSEEWKKHTELGYNMIRNDVEPTAAAVVLHHHQHFDGSGFPSIAAMNGPLSGQNIHIFCRIATAADTFQHLLKHDGMIVPTVQALWQMQQKPMVDWFDPTVLAALLTVVPPFIPGMVVQLTDGRQAVVTQTNYRTPCYPTVQIIRSLAAQEENKTEIVDLSAAEDTLKLSIQKVDGFDVTKYLYGPRKALGTQVAAQVPVAMAG